MKAATVLLTVLGAVVVCHASSIDYSLSLEDMFDKADFVAVVEITAADSEHFETWSYRAQVKAPIKNSGEGQAIYFGSAESYQDGEETSYKLGGEYLVFLVKSTQLLDQQRTTASGPWKEDGHLFFYYEVCANSTVLPIELILNEEKWEWRVGMETSCFKIPEQLDTVTFDELPIHGWTDSWVLREELLGLLRTYASRE